jgi:hypothetical protein
MPHGSALISQDVTGSAVSWADRPGLDAQDSAPSGTWLRLHVLPSARDCRIQGAVPAWLAAAVIAYGSGLTGAPATSTVGVALTPISVARAVTYVGQSR